MEQNWYYKPAGLETRWATCENPRGEKGQGALSGMGRKGCPCMHMAPGETRVLAHVQGRSGMVRRIWMAIQDYDKAYCLKGLKLEIFWDVCEKPAVSVPVGDFFLHVPNRVIPVDCAAFTSAEGRSFICYIPMPFKDGMKMTLTNASGREVNNLFYEVDYTLGDPFIAGTLYFHAFYHRSVTRRMEDYEILPRIGGSGRYLGTAMTIQAYPLMPGWWGEGEVKVYLDGDDDHPTLCGTGSEDYIGASWEMGEFTGWYQGCLSRSGGSASFYRFHVPDPLYFSRDIRMTIQQLGLMWPYMREQFKACGTTIVYRAGGKELFDLDNGEPGLYEREGDDLASIAYFYLDAPCTALPPADMAQCRRGYEEKEEETP